MRSHQHILRLALGPKHAFDNTAHDNAIEQDRQLIPAWKLGNHQQNLEGRKDLPVFS